MCVLWDKILSKDTPTKTAKGKCMRVLQGKILSKDTTDIVFTATKTAKGKCMCFMGESE